MVLDVRGRRCLVVGGGTVAARKVSGLLAAGARVDVVAIDVGPEIRALAAEADSAITIEERPYRAGEVAGYRLAVAATDDRSANQAVFDDAERAGIWVNAADDPDRCSYTLPAILRRGDVAVAVSTGGRSPALASWLRDQLAEVVGPEYVDLVGLLASVRDAQHAAGRSSESTGWRTALDSDMLALVREGRISDARELLERCLSSS